jgi:hypothetical protein
MQAQKFEDSDKKMTRDRTRHIAGLERSWLVAGEISEVWETSRCSSLDGFV